MHFYFNFIISFVIFVLFVKYSKTTVSVDVTPAKHVLKLCSHANSSCIHNILTQQFIIFNSEINQNITAKLGDLQSILSINENFKSLSMKIYTDRRGYLPPSNSNEITINSICQFSYSDEKMAVLDNEFCCRIDLMIESSDPMISNPYSFCEMRIQQKEVTCFFPIKFTFTQFLSNKIFPLIGKIYKKKNGNCDYQPVFGNIYSVSRALSISFSMNLPVIWKLSDKSISTVLLGTPLHSVIERENLLIPVRLLSDRADLTKQIIRIQCRMDQNLFYNSAITNYPNVSVIDKNTFSDNYWNFINMNLKMTPGLDQQLMFLNVTVMLDKKVDDTVNSIKLQCCVLQKEFKNFKENACKETNIVEIPLKQSKSILMIPAVNDTNDILSIYSKPIIQLNPNEIKVFGVTNYNDKTVMEITSRVLMRPFDDIHLVINQKLKNKNSINMEYQTFLNPWSVELSFMNSVQTLISPVRIWRPESWKLMLSDEILRPIKDWVVPQSHNDICVPRYKVARLKILCRLFLVEETGEKRYLGTEDNKNQIPYIDVTSETKLEQISMSPKDQFSIELSSDKEYFLISPHTVGRSSNIELVSLDSDNVLASTQISAHQEEIHVVDLIVHCIDAVTLAQQNRSIKSINSPYDHKSITVSLTSNSPSKPCYLVVFVVFSDKSIERISSINTDQYRLFVKSGEIIKPVNDSQLITVRHLPNVNMSLYQPISCRESHLIFSKKIEWTIVVESANIIIPITSTTSTTQTTTHRNKTKELSINHEPISSINLVHISIYICTGFIALCFICCILCKLICYRNGNDESRNGGGVSTNYQRSGSEYLEDTSIKVPIRASNSKNFSALGKCSTNCLRQNANKNHSNEPYPPLLPPPGPIAANYDLTLSDPVCNDSAVDSGVELGKLSSYSSNTCPSNDLCCTVDLYPSCSGTDDSLMHQPYQSPHYTSPMVGFYPPKGIIESDTQYHDSMMLSSLNTTKTISNLRHPYW